MIVFNALHFRRKSVPNIPIRAERVSPLALKTRKLIEDAERAVAMHDGDLTDFARQIQIGRKQRDRYFDPMLFSNPAWDILLNLFVADADGRAISVIDCCAASTVPQGVALRWLTYLKQEEMVIEVTDPDYPRQTLIRLSDPTRMAIRSYLGSLVSLGLGPEPRLPDIPSAGG
jgi:hypothetical protein